MHPQADCALGHKHLPVYGQSCAVLKLLGCITEGWESTVDALLVMYGYGNQVLPFNSFPSISVYGWSNKKHKKVECGHVACDLMIEKKKHASQTNGVERETVRRNSSNMPGPDRSGKLLLLNYAEFNILKLNVFVTRAMKSQNLF